MGMLRSVAAGVPAGRGAREGIPAGGSARKDSRTNNPKSKIQNPKSLLAAQLRWPPSLHGTGTEDWCNTAFGPSQEYQAPCHGILLYSGDENWKWRGKQSIYRYHIADPIRFRKRILATIEHGHANKLSNDYASTAYYYLAQPRRGGPPLPPVEARLSRPDVGT